MPEYTYYAFWDDLCLDHVPDNYRMGPEGFQFQIELQGIREWILSGFADIDDLMDNAIGQGRYKVVDVDG